MKTISQRIAVFIITVTFTAMNSFAQTNEFGVGAVLYKQSGTLIATYDPGSLTGNINYEDAKDESNGAPAVMVAHYHPFYELSDMIAIGGQAGFVFYGYYERKDDTKNFYGQTIAPGTSSDLIIGWEVPLYVNLRLMNGSTDDNDDGFGLGVGIGYTAHGFNVVNDKGFMFSPSLLAEIKYNTLGLRYERQFKKYESVYTSDTGDIPRLSTSFSQIFLTIRF